MSTDQRSIAGRVAFITGAGSGIGRAAARLFAAQGARVALADVNGEAVQGVAAEIEAAGGAARAFVLDVADAQAVALTVPRAADALGGLDFLINNAGISRAQPIDDPAYDQLWDEQMAVLLVAQQRLVRAALPLLRRSSGARIVNIASTEGLGATPGCSVYTVAKHGVIGLTRSLAVELGREGITVNAVCPGPTHTGMTRKIPDEAKAAFARKRTALGRYGEPEEVAHVIVSLCLPGWSYVTGAVIPVDGGLTIRYA